MTAAGRFNWYPLAITALLLLSGWAVFSRAMLRQVNHDEPYFLYILPDYGQLHRQPVQLDAAAGAHAGAFHPAPGARWTDIHPVSAVCAGGWVDHLSFDGHRSICLAGSRFDPARQRQQNRVLAAQDLPALFAAQPPAAFLVGEEGDLEISLVDYARQNGYTLTPVAEKLQLWLRNPTKNNGCETS